VSASVVDISVPLDGRTPVWPGSPGFTSSPHLSLSAGDVANATLIKMDVHCGTHVDAPRHFVKDGATVDALPPASFVGPAWLADAVGHEAIDAVVLEGLDIPPETTRLLLRTDNSLGPRGGPFREDYVALTAGAAQWVVDRGLELIGIDYLSIQRFHDPPDVHHVLLRAGIVILEGLDLGGVRSGRWTLVCLPMALVGIEAAPARALLLEENSLA
jgi:arylformamidase